MKRPPLFQFLNRAPTPRPRLISACARIAASACAALIPLAAYAELSNDPLLGPGLRWRPAYDGSADSGTEWVPVVRYLGPTGFVRSTQGVLEGGVRLELAPGLHVGGQLAYEPGRKASESTFLVSRNAADISRGVSIGAQLELDHKFGLCSR